MKVLYKLILVFSLIFYVACATTTVDKLVRKKGFEPFELCRDFNGVGTIFRIEDGKEILIRSPSYLPSDIEISKGNVALESVDQKVKLSLKVMNFVEDLDKTATGLNIKNINKTKLVFRNPFSEKIAVGDLKDLLKEGKIPVTCAEDLLDKDNYLIVGIIGAKQMAYEFWQKKTGRIVVDDDFISDILGIEAGIDYERETDHRLIINFPCYIGYKVVKFYKFLKGKPENYIIGYNAHELPQQNMQLRKIYSMKKIKIEDPVNR